MSRQSDIWEYLQGERTGKRANRFEREMLSDPFLYEAVEGLTTVKADHEKIVQQLQKRMKKREGNKTVRLYRWGAAASLLLLAGLAVILMNRSALRQQEVVVAEMDKSEPIIRPDSLQLMAAQLDERGVTDTVTLPVRKIIGKIAGKEQVFYRQVQAVEDMDSESDESGSADVLSEPVAEVMEGKYRPGHFNGVAQIVSKLFYAVTPDRAYFGEKDFQQIAVIRSMVKLINSPVEIVDCPIVREEDGLALSSRNRRLTPEQRKNALNISATLFKSRTFAQNHTVAETLAFVVDTINAVDGLEVEYYEIVDGRTLLPVESWDQTDYVVGCVTVYCGEVRLIDNVIYHR